MVWWLNSKSTELLKTENCCSPSNANQAIQALFVQSLHEPKETSLPRGLSCIYVPGKPEPLLMAGDFIGSVVIWRWSKLGARPFWLVGAPPILEPILVRIGMAFDPWLLEPILEPILVKIWEFDPWQHGVCALCPLFYLFIYFFGGEIRPRKWRSGPLSY